MAKFEVVTAKVKKLVEVETTEEQLHLTLSKDEVAALWVVLRRIGGSPTKSMRKYTDNVYRAIYKAGLKLLENVNLCSVIDEQNTDANHICFKNTLE